MSGRPRKPRTVEERDDPTPQTVAKLRYDVIGRALQEGRIHPEQMAAAQEIRQLIEAWTRGFGSGGGNVTSDSGGTRFNFQTIDGGGFREPIDRLTDAEERNWRLHYKPFAEQMKHVVVCGAPERATALSLTIDVAVDNNPFGQLDKRYRLRNGTASDIVRHSLWKYAQLAGWT